MARRLSVRKETGRPGCFTVGPCGHKEAPTVSVVASDKRDALKRGKARLRAKGLFQQAVRKSFRHSSRIGVRNGREVRVTMDTRPSIL